MDFGVEVGVATDLTDFRRSHVGELTVLALIIGQAIGSRGGQPKASR